MNDPSRPGSNGHGLETSGRPADEVIVMTTLCGLGRTLRRLYDEQAYAWERLFRAGLPDPAAAREAASFRRWERELSLK
jgi:hypothetical protein